MGAEVVSCSWTIGQMERQAGGHDEANGHFLQYCEGAQK